jgi:hypothetical protein
VADAVVAVDEGGGRPLLRDPNIRTRPAASNARLMKAANAGAAMRGASAASAVLASLAMRPDMSIPICAPAAMSS